jgi:hypothetical protein
MKRIKNVRKDGALWLRRQTEEYSEERMNEEKEGLMPMNVRG